MENGDAYIDSDPGPTYADAFPPLTPSSAFHSTMSSSSMAHTLPATESSWPIKPIPTSTATQVFHVPVEERKYVSHESSFGEHAADITQAGIVREIMEKTGCTIEMSQAKDQSLTIMVTGRPSSVSEARRMIISSLQQQFTTELKIPKEHHKTILGKQGSRLKGIELSTATKIHMPRADEPSDSIRISGTKEGVDKAKHQLQIISDEQAKLAFERLEIDHEFQPFISGPDGSTAESIAKKTGARINIPPYTMRKSEITIAGEKENVAKAKAQVLKIYTEMKRMCSTVSVEVRKSQHRYVVGPKGQGIQEILQNTGVYVEVPHLNEDDCTITLRGPTDKLGIALTQVYAKANSVVTEEVSAPAWLYRFIIGRAGHNVKKITQDLPHVQVTFMRGEDKILIEGPPDEVQLAKESFETFTEDLKATMVFAEVHVDQKFHSHIIGKKGANVNKIKTETCTSIIIPSDAKAGAGEALPPDVIRIEGDPKGVAAAKKMILEMAAKLENERTKQIMIDQRWHKMVIGANGENMKEVHDRFSGVHVAFPEPGKRSSEVTLRGPRDEVEKCAKYLKKMADDIAAANYREEVRVFKKFHGNVIGRGGATLRKIREETNTRIEMPSESTDSDTIVIVGRRENVEKARKMIVDIEKQMASVLEVKISIPHRLHNSIIGPRGKLIRSVMEECGGVRIHFPSSDSTSDEISIHGPKDDVERARSMLAEMRDKQVQSNYTVDIKCKPAYHRFLIGRGGANIRKVRDKFEARIIFPQKGSDDDVETITIIGRKENAEAAKAHLLKLIKDLDNVVEEEVEVDPKYHKFFIQRRGQMIHEISEENGGVNISFPRVGSNSSKVLLKGAKQCVEGARIAIREVVEDLEAQVVVECAIPHKHHRDVMGAKGANVQAVSQENNVTIKFPDRATRESSSGAGEGASGENGGDKQNGVDATKSEEELREKKQATDPRDVIVITGRAENCEKAKQALLELVPVDIVVEVPYKFHRYIIGQRGQKIRTMADQYGVVIEIPRAELEEDSIFLHGPAKNCAEAKEALLLRVKDLEAEEEERELRSHCETIQVDSQYHPSIIGRHGATITKIRKEHDVHIQLPDKDSSNPDEIVIIGYEHQVQAAKEDILHIVKELEDQISEEVEIDHRVHSRLIGAKGKAIAKVMDQFNVVVRFPRDKQTNTVTISGMEENVEDAKDHLLMLADDYMQDVIERQEEKELYSQYTRPAKIKEHGHERPGMKGFVVRDAPWSASDFPAIATNVGAPSANTPSQKPPSWGPSVLGPKLPKQ